MLHNRLSKIISAAGKLTLAVKLSQWSCFLIIASADLFKWFKQPAMFFPNQMTYLSAAVRTCFLVFLKTDLGRESVRMLWCLVFLQLPSRL